MNQNSELGGVCPTVEQRAMWEAKAKTHGLENGIPFIGSAGELAPVPNVIDWSKVQYNDQGLYQGNSFLYHVDKGLGRPLYRVFDEKLDGQQVVGVLGYVAHSDKRASGMFLKMTSGQVVICTPGTSIIDLPHFRFENAMASVTASLDEPFDFVVFETTNDGYLYFSTVVV